ncbi:hypothetical protein M0813_28922 [Anaeramoeba flamelloides]|uniref:Uncharacterized protein n=1 Tax=Anaeramoeba flamelloides TaxID=1746091 RepID=A0ABQ8XRI4_9EUKA|nr:hypothetical protein M0813_28922 [Anaeramoeba flamelloides]
MGKGVNSKLCPCCNKKKMMTSTTLFGTVKNMREPEDTGKKELKKIKIFEYNLIVKKDEDELLRKMNIKEIYDITIEYLLISMAQHTIREKERKTKKNLISKFT